MAGPPPPLLDALHGHARTAVVLTGADLGAGLPIVEATPAFAALVGIAPGEAIGRPLLGFVAPRTPAGEVARIRAAVGAGAAVLGELAVVRADGTVVWVEADVAPLPGPAAAGVVTVMRDVTERRRTERALARAGHVLSSATAAGGVGIWEWDPETNAVAWNTTLRRILGVGDDEPADVERWFALTHPEDRPLARRIAADRLLAGEARYRIVRPDGEVRHIVVHGGGPGQDGDGPLFGTVVDVTEHRSAATRVAETLESITDAYFAVDRSWRFTYVNRHAEELLRAAREDLLGRELWTCLPAPAGTALERGLRAALDEGRTVTFEAHWAPDASWFEVRAYPVPDGIAVSLRNIDARRAADAERERLLAEVHHQATHDSLTGLSTRDALTARLDAALAAGHAVSVLFVDVDRFKLVNDSLGHAVGDGLLRLLAERVRSLTRAEDVVARIGGDEFVVGLVDTARPVVQSVAERVLHAARAPATVGSHVLVMSASVGISEAAAGGDAATLLRDADVALYRAKDAGRDQAVWFDERARTDLLERVQIERDLRAAVAGDELALHFQPGFDLRTGRRAGVEALVRWRHPRRGFVPPSAFIPVAEDSGLIAGVGEWVLAAAARTAAGWPAGAAGATVWANVSARQLARPGLAATIRRVLGEAGLRPAALGIEVTETAIGEHEEVVGELLRVADLGVRIALDDFGTGYSSVARLRALPVDLLKIDRSFVAALGEPGGVATVAAIVDLGHALGKTVIAEGVETAEQLVALRRTGCDEVAGFLLARPVPPAELPRVAGAGEERLGGPGLRLAL